MNYNLKTKNLVQLANICLKKMSFVAYLNQYLNF